MYIMPMKDYQIRAKKNYYERNKEMLNEKARNHYHECQEYKEKNFHRSHLRNEYLKGVRILYRIDPTIFT
jgi:hypothetical protein